MKNVNEVQSKSNATLTFCHFLWLTALRVFGGKSTAFPYIMYYFPGMKALTEQQPSLDPAPELFHLNYHLSVPPL